MNIVIGLLARDTVEDISFHTSSSRLYDSALEKSKPICRLVWRSQPQSAKGEGLVASLY